ncbi:MAG: ISL3 family transposase, partial [Actinobacteria bacterium]|nr:ISL3 family transposase [Actinomycetota bacterium]
NHRRRETPLLDRIDVPLQLEDFEVTNTEVIGDVLEVSVRSTRRPACHHCGSIAVTGHGRNQRRIRDRSCRYPCVLVWSQRRMKCDDCGRTFRERHPEVAGRRAVTERFRRRLFERACNEPFTDVAAGESVSCYRVLEAFEHHCVDVDRGPVEPPRVLAIDESAFKKRFMFHTVFSDPERGYVFDLVEGRHKGAVFGGLMKLEPQVSAAIETVVMDLHWPFRQAVEEFLPDARIVADKFHVLRSVDTAAAKVRIRFARRTTRRRTGRDGGVCRQHNPAFDPGMQRAKWTFMKRAGKLSDKEKAWLDELFEVWPPEVVAAWWLKEEFAAIYEAPDRAEAERRLEIWIDHIIEADLSEFTNLWRSLQWWTEPILAYFEDRVTNAFAEGITNKIKVMKRRSYGFRDPVRYRHKVLLTCGYGRTGRSIHRFS